MGTIFFAVAAFLLSGARAQEYAGDVSLKLPTVACVSQEGPASMRWRAADTFAVTTTLTADHEADMIDQLEMDAGGGYGSAVGAGYGDPVRLDDPSWEGVRTYMPASLLMRALEGSDIVAEAHLVAFDRNTQACRAAVEWTREGITFTKVEPSCINVFVTEYTLAPASSPFVSDLINQRVSDREVDLGTWAPYTKALRAFTSSDMGPTWRVFVERLSICQADLDILKNAPYEGSFMVRDATQRGVKLFYEACEDRECAQLWDRCDAQHPCCDGHCIRKNAHYAQCRDGERMVPAHWDGSVV